MNRQMEARVTKPLGQKAYGSIPHLHGSRRGPADKGVNEGQHRICCERRRDKHVGAGEVRLHRAAAIALAAVVARLPPGERPRDDREARRDAGDLQPVGRLLDEQLVAPRLRRRVELPVGLVGQPLPAPEIDPALYEELDQIRAELGEVHERLDFTERLLANDKSPRPTGEGEG